tara:strand:+ start:1907 stop:2188 length:282 start_codon:yes stop_codon:yes gene_type:complete
MIFDESMDDFYCLVDILEDNLAVAFYMIKSLQKKKHRPKEIRRLLHFRSHKVLHYYIKQLLDKPIAEFNTLKDKALDKIIRDTLNNKIDLTEI